jgi:tRNA(Ile)-lysidine synthase
MRILLRDIAQNKLIFEALQTDIKKEAKKTKTTIEECARNIRKKWLESIRKKYNADLIATAHHSDDQAETILYRITNEQPSRPRIGIESLAGSYIRPLLSIHKR